MLPVEAWGSPESGSAPPFALRALGVVREDERLVEQARDRFDALGLPWHASQTALLLGDG